MGAGIALGTGNIPGLNVAAMNAIICFAVCRSRIPGDAEAVRIWIAPKKQKKCAGRLPRRVAPRNDMLFECIENLPPVNRSPGAIIVYWNSKLKVAKIIRKAKLKAENSSI